jgi:hypothetical protein
VIAGAPVPDVTPVVGTVGTATQSLLNRVTGAIGSPLSGLPHSLTLPGATVGARLPLP